MPLEFPAIRDKLTCCVASGLAHTYAVAVDAEYAVYAAEAEYAVYAEYAAEVGALFEHGIAPWGVEGVEPDGSAYTRLLEHGIVPWGVEGVESDGQVYVQDERGQIHADLVAETVAVDEADECI